MKHPRIEAKDMKPGTVYATMWRCDGTVCGADCWCPQVVRVDWRGGENWRFVTLWYGAFISDPEPDERARAWRQLICAARAYDCPIYHC